jgi:hypothetical protein
MSTYATPFGDRSEEEGEEVITAFDATRKYVFCPPLGRMQEASSRWPARRGSLQLAQRDIYTAS